MKKITHEKSTILMGRNLIHGQLALAELLKVRPETISIKTTSGELPHFRIGRKCMYDLDEVLASLKSTSKLNENG